MRLNPRTSVSATLLLLALSACENGAPARPTPPLPCAYTLSATTLSIGPNGGSASISVTTASQCTWTAASGDAWIAVTSGASGTGTGTVTIGIAANPTTVDTPHSQRSSTTSVRC